MDLLALGVNVACWGAIVVVWIVAAVREVGKRPVGRVRGATDPGMVVLAVVAVAVVVVLGRAILSPFTIDATWARLIGAGVLIACTLFALWARLALGSSWSVDPQAATDRGLRTDGPYAITRHPIYTGLLGMLVGSALLGGLGQAMVLVPAGSVVVWLKVRAEEQLLLATFPHDYAAYRQRVPRLIPAWPSPSGRQGR